MRGLFYTLIVVLVAFMIVTTEAGKNKKGWNIGIIGIYHLSPLSFLALVQLPYRIISCDFSL